jgi:DNA-binding NarL/FixJ family response regulator
MRKISVLLADDHMVVREGLRALLTSQSDIHVVAEAADGRQAVSLARRDPPDVVVMDIAMPYLNGMDATRQIVKSCPGTAVLVLSSYWDQECVGRLLHAGAAGYLAKQTAATELSQAIRDVHTGKQFVSPAIVRQMRERERMVAEFGGKDNLVLTPREIEVLQLVAEGYSNKEAAEHLGISIKTIEKHRQQVMNKLNIHETAGLTRYALARERSTGAAPPVNEREPVQTS